MLIGEISGCENKNDIIGNSTKIVDLTWYNGNTKISSVMKSVAQSGVAGILGAGDGVNIKKCFNSGDISGKRCWNRRYIWMEWLP